MTEQEQSLIRMHGHSRQGRASNRRNASNTPAIGHRPPPRRLGAMAGRGIPLSYVLGSTAACHHALWLHAHARGRQENTGGGRPHSSVKKSNASSAVSPIDAPDSGACADHRGDVISLIASARIEYAKGER